MQASSGCIEVLVPCIDSLLCQEQLTKAHKIVAAAVEKIVFAAQVRAIHFLQCDNSPAIAIWKFQNTLAINIAYM